MSEQTAVPKPSAVSRWTAVLSTVIGSFGLGIWVGKRLLGSKPLDWFLDITTALCMLFWTVSSAVKAARNSPLERL